MARKALTWFCLFGGPVACIPQKCIFVFSYVYIYNEYIAMLWHAYLAVFSDYRHNFWCEHNGRLAPLPMYHGENENGLE